MGLGSAGFSNSAKKAEEHKGEVAESRGTDVGFPLFFLGRQCSTVNMVTPISNALERAVSEGCLVVTKQKKSSLLKGTRFPKCNLNKLASFSFSTIHTYIHTYAHITTIYIY